MPRGPSDRQRHSSRGSYRLPPPAHRPRESWREARGPPPKPTGGPDCAYATGHGYGNGTVLYSVFAHDGDTCCKACAATAGCAGANWFYELDVPDAPDAMGNTEFGWPAASAIFYFFGGFVFVFGSAGGGRSRFREPPEKKIASPQANRIQYSP